MLGLIGLLGALFASVLADSMFSQYDEDDGEAAENDGWGDENQSGNSDGTDILDPSDVPDENGDTASASVSMSWVSAATLVMMTSIFCPATAALISSKVLAAMTS